MAALAAQRGEGAVAQPRRAPGTHEDQLHALIAPRGRLEEDRLGVRAIRARRVRRAWERRVFDHVRAGVGHGIRRSHVVDEDQIAVCRVLVLAVTAHAPQRFRHRVLFGIQHVAALGAKPEGRLPAGVGIVLDARPAARRDVLELLLLPGDAVVATGAAQAQAVGGHHPSCRARAWQWTRRGFAHVRAVNSWSVKFDAPPPSLRPHASCPAPIYAHSMIFSPLLRNRVWGLSLVRVSDCGDLG